MEKYFDKHDHILNSIINAAYSSGYHVLCADQESSYTFDLILKREELLVIKISYNVSLMNEDAASSLASFAKNIDAYPIIIGVVNRNERIEDGVLYTRYSIPVLSPRTFIDFIKNEEKPLVRAGPGGFYVDIDGEKLKKLREERNISLGDLASVTNTSRRTILLYENGMSMSLEIALKLEEYLNTELIKATSILIKSTLGDAKPNFKKMKEFERLVSSLLESKGFDVYSYRKSMINMVIKEEMQSFLSGLELEDENFRRKMEFIRKMSDLVNREGFLIVKEKDKFRHVDVPIITVQEIKNISDRREIKYLIEERKED